MCSALVDFYLLISRPRIQRKMYGFLVTFLVLDAFFLGVVILLQAGKGGGLAAMGGGAAATEGILAGRQATTVLTRATWISGSAFMVLALVLSVMSSRASQPTSILRSDVLPAAAPAPEPVLPGLTTTPAQGDGAGQEGGGAAEQGGGSGDAGNIP
jgi:preprotein translocase subunit SecG